ncbi:NAD(P)H-dependent oxidoreductase subunit E [Burkholderia vietnamiensis]|uniref:NAD(P)H-dependent oxidoreductase subunit E n=1 Tax=Burkholderia vietnamiensis TaxID=60552 RepID=UPI000D787688|nr:NAD(P)H-dependent oxidoreductase subunit E [Burkholderia vietnamiensis]GBH26216.1 NAD-dependent formate dehydrogenase subunit gamma [Burkholderia vietnamiensis]
MSPNSPAPDALVERHARAGRSLVAILHAIQDDAGYVPAGCVAPLAKAPNLSRAEVHGVLTYYHHFRPAPPARVTIQMGRAEACRSMGCEALAEHAQARTGCRFDAAHGDAADPHAPPDVALESVYCLGLCAQSPSMTINGVLHAKVTPEKFDALLAQAAAHTPEAA